LMKKQQKENGMKEKGLASQLMDRISKSSQ
jgi:hypothetical protein